MNISHIERKAIVMLIFLIFPVFSISQGGPYVVPLYWISPGGAYNPNMISTTVWTAYFSSNGNLRAVVGPLNYDYPYIYSRSPSDSYVSNYGNESLECNVSDSDWLKNISFYTNLSGSWNLLGTYNLTGYADSASQNITFSNDFSWYCYACDDLGYCTNSSVWTVYYNASIPEVNLSLPENNSYVIPRTLNFSCNASSLSPLDTMTIYIWKNRSLYYTNSTSASGNFFIANFSAYLSIGDYEWNCKANNSDSYSAFAVSNYTLHVVSSSSPVIIEAWANPPIIIKGSNETLYINAINSDLVYANITLPNGSLITFNLTNNANNSFSNTSLVGIYNITFVAKNSATNEYAFAYDYFIAVPPVLFNITVVNSSYNGSNSSLEVVYDGWVYYNASSPNGNFTISLPSYVFNITITALSGNSISFFELLNVSNDTNKIFGVDRKVENQSILYGFNSSFTSPSLISLRLVYPPLSLPFSYIHCKPFNFSSMQCDSGTGISGNIEGSYIIFNLSNLSSEGFKIIKEREEDGGDTKKRLDVSIEGNCIEEPVIFIVKDRQTGDPVEARIYIRFDMIWNDIYYGSSVSLTLPYEGSYYYSVKAEGYIGEEGRFSLEQCYSCSTDNDCGENQYCEEGQCKEVECECGVVVNHKCNKFECCSDSDCKGGRCLGNVCVECIDNNDCSSNEICNAQHLCEEVECECGYIENHTCYAYECCKDSDCGNEEICENNTCRPFDIEIIAPGEAIEGELIEIQLLIEGAPSSGEELYIDGEKHVTDENGYVKIFAPPHDIEVAYKGRVQKIKVIPVEKIIELNLSVEHGEFFKDVPVEIALFDSSGNPVKANIEVTAPDGSKKVFYNVHKIRYVPSIEGKYVVKGFGENYLTKTKEVEVKSCKVLNLDFGRWSFIVTLCWYMWLLIIAIISFVSYVYYKIIKNKKIKSKGGKK